MNSSDSSDDSDDSDDDKKGNVKVGFGYGGIGGIMN
jgi:hypothetical protein